MAKQWLAGFVAQVLLVSGCAGPQPQPLPGPGAVVPSRPAAAQPPGEPSPATLGLLQEAREQYRAGNWAGAIASAERGLRIDRRSTEFYLVLAQSYLQLAESEMAENFAYRGMRYATPGSELWHLFSAVLESARAAAPKAGAKP